MSVCPYVITVEPTIIKHTNNYDHYPVKIDGNTHKRRHIYGKYGNWYLCKSGEYLG